MMKLFSQGMEDQYILEFFADREITFFDGGANDGITLSNTHALALNGSSGICVEPSREAFARLKHRYRNNNKIKLFNCALDEKEGEVTLYHSGSHLTENDISLLSTIKKQETKRWGNTATFEEQTVHARTVNDIIKESGFEKIHFISLDIEGIEIPVLRQIDLKKLGTECACIEYNSNEKILKEIMEICAWYGLTNILLKNAENILLTK